MTQRKIFNGIIALFTYLLIILLLIMITEVHAQRSSHAKIYRTKITTKDGMVKKGYLVGVQDTIVLLSESPYVNHSFEVKSDEIKSIRIHKKGSVVRGAVIGAAVGTLAGYIIGYPIRSLIVIHTPFSVLILGRNFQGSAQCLSVC